jgi:CHASE3 domain sensor protein
MRFRLGLMLGFAIGYVLGTKAGTQRYLQIQRAWSTITRSQPAQHLGAEVRDVASRAGDALEHRAAEGVDKVTELVRSGEAKFGNGRTARLS